MQWGSKDQQKAAGARFGILKAETAKIRGTLRNILAGFVLGGAEG
jgi:hypothetical protein